jgi:hypothetical protein
VKPLDRPMVFRNMVAPSTRPPYVGQYRAAWLRHRRDSGHSLCSPSHCGDDIARRVCEILDLRHNASVDSK